MSKVGTHFSFSFGFFSISRFCFCVFPSSSSSLSLFRFDSIRFRFIRSRKQFIITYLAGEKENRRETERKKKKKKKSASRASARASTHSRRQSVICNFESITQQQTVQWYLARHSTPKRRLQCFCAGIARLTHTRERKRMRSYVPIRLCYGFMNCEVYTMRSAMHIVTTTRTTLHFYNFFFFLSFLLSFHSVFDFYRMRALASHRNVEHKWYGRSLRENSFLKNWWDETNDAEEMWDDARRCRRISRIHKQFQTDEVGETEAFCLKIKLKRKEKRSNCSRLHRCHRRRRRRCRRRRLQCDTGSIWQR